MTYAADPRNDAPAKPPLAVDLDGTLFKGDLFTEALARFLASEPLGVFRLVGWLMRGRAYAKAKLAEHAPCDPEHLPYNAEFLDWLTAERAAGRRVSLATAADRKEAEAVATHLGLFEEVFASDGQRNLKARSKAERLREAYPEGFAYAGNEAADFHVWRAAVSAVVVNAPADVARRAQRQFDVEQVHPRTGRQGLSALIKAIRPHQWAKNALVFVPMVVGQGWLQMDAWIHAGLAFFAISCVASSVYLINDASDIDADRRHHRKRTRPFASGALSLWAGAPASLLLAGAGFALGVAAGAWPLVALYLAMNLLYTFWLKTKRIADVFMLTGMYILRVILGGVATGFLASSWLLAFCGFFFSLAVCKRVIEVETAAAGGGDGLERRGYIASDGLILKMLGVGAGLVSCLVLALYIQSDIATSGHYRWPLALWVLPASVMFWFCHVWMKAERGDLHDDPLVFAFRDRVSWMVALIAAIGLGAAMLVPAPGLAL